MSNKKYFSLLPEVFQTPVNKAFFDSTYEQLFASKEVEKLDGYIGRRISGLWNPAEDYFLAENSKNRTWYQLEPIAVSTDPTTVTDSNEMFYEDLINKINFYGGLTDNHDRLFSNGYYTFAPPIDSDKFINYQAYKWVKDVPVLTLHGVSDTMITSDILGQLQYTHASGSLRELEIDNGGTGYILGDVLYLDGGSGSQGSATVTKIDSLTGEITNVEVLFGGYSYAKTDTNLSTTSGSGAGAIFNVAEVYSFTYGGDIYDVDVVFTSGMRVSFNDAPRYSGVYTIESVGRGIALVEDGVFSFETFDIPEYVTIERGAQDNNTWSRRNKWYHNSIIQFLQTTLDFDVPVVNARRPILEFTKDIELYNFGTEFKGVVDYISSDEFQTIHGANILIEEQLLAATSIEFVKAETRIDYSYIKMGTEVIPTFLDEYDTITVTGTNDNNSVFTVHSVDWENNYIYLKSSTSYVQVVDEIVASCDLLFNDQVVSINGVEVTPSQGDTILFNYTNAASRTITFDNIETFSVGDEPYDFQLNIPFIDSDGIVVNVTREASMVFAAGPDSITLSGSKWPITLEAGDTITIAGAVTTANNGTHTVVSRTNDFEIIVSSALTNETFVGTTTFNDVDWYSVEDQSNILSFKADSKNLNWPSTVDDIDGLIPEDTIVVTVGDEPLVLNVADYIWEVTYVTDVNGNTQLKLIPQGTLLNVMQEGDVVIYLDLTQQSQLKKVSYYVKTSISWTSDVQKRAESVLVTPKFNLYYTDLDDADQPLPLGDMSGSNFDGSEIFSYKVNPDSNNFDKYIGHPLEYKNLGQIADIVFEHDLMTDRYDYILNDVLTEIKGYYFFKQYINGVAEYNTTWLESPNNSKQRITDYSVVKNLRSTKVETYYFESGDSSFELDYIGVLAQESITTKVNGVLTDQFTITETNKRYTIGVAATEIGRVNEIRITNAGIGYATSDVLYLEGSTGTGLVLTVTAIDVNGEILAANITNKGYGYLDGYLTGNVEVTEIDEGTSPSAGTGAIFEVSSAGSEEIIISYTTNDVFQISVQPEMFGSEYDLNVILQGDYLNQVDDFSLFEHNGSNTYVYIKKPFNYGDVIHFSTYSKDALPPTSNGFYEIPAQLEANTLNGEVYEYTSNELTKQFMSAILNQDGFSGDELSFNNYRDTLKDMSLGTEILQCKDNVLKTMLTLSDKSIDLIDSIRFSRNEYARFKDKVLNTCTRLVKEKYEVDIENAVKIDALIKEILNRINNSVFYNEAFKNSHMFSHSYFYFEQSFTDGDVPTSNEIQLDIVETIDFENPANAIYVYRGSRDDLSNYIVTNEVCDVVGVDYNVISTSPVVIQLNNYNNEEILVRVYTDSIPDYAPTTPTKNGMYKAWVPTLKLDTSFVTPTYVIVGHDGSKTPTIRSSETIVTNYAEMSIQYENNVAPGISGTVYTYPNHRLNSGDRIIFSGTEYVGVGDVKGHQIYDEDGGLTNKRYYVVKLSSDRFTLVESLNEVDGALSDTVADALVKFPSPLVDVDEDGYTYGYNDPIYIHRIEMSDMVLLEIERRIYNGVHPSFKNDYVPALNKVDIFSDYFRSNEYSDSEFMTIMRPHFYRWKADSNSNYKDHFSYDENDWKTWNYKSANPSLPGHWKGIYRYIYGTISPDSTPWEMLGFTEKPTWWDLYYSPWQATNIQLADGGDNYQIGDRLTFQEGIFNTPITILVNTVLAGAITSFTVISAGEMVSEEVPSVSSIQPVNIDGIGSGAIFALLVDGNNNIWERKYSLYEYGSTNDRMWGDIEYGVIRSGARSGVDAKYIKAGLSTILPVDANGEILAPHVIGVAIEPTIDKERDWDFGDFAPVEESWRCSSEYVYCLMEAFMVAKPAMFGELFFDTLDTINAPINENQVINKTTYKRTLNADQVVHGETDADGNTVEKYGYQHFISDYITFNGGNIKSQFGDKIRELRVKLSHKLAGFTDPDTLDLFMQSVNVTSNNIALVIPKENVTVKLFKTPIIREYVYSGVVIRADDNGYYIAGYDTLSNVFKYYPKKKNATVEKIHVGGKTVEYSFFKIGKPYVPGQYVKYNTAFHECMEAHTPSKFVPELWRRVEHLPYTGGVVVDYAKEREDYTLELEYGTVLRTANEVFDFLVGYGVHLLKDGWAFEMVDESTGYVKNWFNSAKDFCYWSLMNWGTNNVLFLNPAAEKLSLKVGYGYPDQITDKNTNGVYSITDQYGYSIPITDVYVDRDGQSISVESLREGTGINSLRVPVTQFEHIISVDNRTIFNDIIYDPILKDRQHRLRVSGYRTTGWYGKHEASGYMINGNTAMQNPENLVESLRYLYDSEVPLDNPDMENAAKHLIGFETKEYLDQIQLSGDAQFKFYQGMITEKGTIQPITKILRSQYIDGNENIEIYEEWAFKLAEFGAVENNTFLEFVIDGQDIKSEPQLVNLMYPYSDGTILHLKKVVVVNSEYSYTVKPKIKVSAPVEGGVVAIVEPVLDEKGYISDVLIKNAGSGYISAPTLTVYAYDKVLKKEVPVYNGEQFEIVMGRDVTEDDKNDDVISIDIDDSDRWISKPKNTRFEYVIPTIEQTGLISTMPNAGYVHLDDVEHLAFSLPKLFDVYAKQTKPVAGEYIWLANGEEINVTWGVYKIKSVAFNDVITYNNIPTYMSIAGVLYNYIVTDGEIERIFDIDLNDVTEDLQDNGSLDGMIEVFVMARYDSASQISAQSAMNNIFWVDDYNGTGWATINNGVVTRRQGKMIDSSLFINGILYDTTSKKTITDFQIYDPFKGILSGPADKNLTFKSDLDPARYTYAAFEYLVDDEFAFTDNQVGLLWWDLSTCRYIQYEQGDAVYRRDNWGRLFDGSSVDIYEWVKSPNPPSSYSGDGEVRNLTDFVQRSEYSTSFDEHFDVYYFWVKNKTTIPNGIYQRTMSASSVSNMIRNPLSQGFEWFAFVDETNYIFSNLEPYFKEAPCVFQITYNSIDDNKKKHVEWKLIREGDKDNKIPTTLWNKMVDSLVEFDRLGNVVPDPRLPVNEKYGNDIRPRKSWFIDVNEARRCLQKSINDILISFNMKDSGVNWEDLVETTSYWKWADWFAEGYDKTNVTPKKQVKNLNVNEDLYDLKDGDIIKEYEKGNSSWYLIVDKSVGEIQLIAREKSSVQLKDELFKDKNKNSLKLELKRILNALTSEVFVGGNKYGSNKVFFAMVNYVMSEQQNVDWMFKTTYISVNHQGQTLKQPTYFRPSTIGSFLAYLNEVKPYSTKIREYNLKYASPIDATKLMAWDFDSLSYGTNPINDQVTLGAASSYDIQSPAFPPTDVPRVFKVTSLYDTVQCGFNDKTMYVEFGQETQFTNGVDNFLFFDDIFSAHTIIADGHELPADYYSLARTGIENKLKITFTKGTPPAGIEIKGISGVTFTHTQLEEARLFKGVGHRDEIYHITSEYNLSSMEFKQTDPLYGNLPTIKLFSSSGNEGDVYWRKSLGNGSKVQISGSKYNDGKYVIDGVFFNVATLVDESLITDEVLDTKKNPVKITVSGYGTNVIFDLKVSAYGEIINGFGNFKFGTIPFGYPGMAEEEDESRHAMFNIAVGTSSRYLHLHPEMRDGITGVAFNDVPRYSMYNEKILIPAEQEARIELQSLEYYQESACVEFGCDFQGLTVDGEDYLYRFTVPWDSEPLDIEGEYPVAGWDREYSEAGVINPVAINGREYSFEYDSSRTYYMDGIVTADFVKEIYVVENVGGSITESPLDVNFFLSYQYDGPTGYKTKIVIFHSLVGYAPNSIIKVVLDPHFMFLSANGQEDYLIPYYIDDINVVSVVDMVDDGIITVGPSEGVASSVIIDVAGSGYVGGVGGDVLLMTGGTGSGLILKVDTVDVNGGISTFTIVSGGAGYVDGDVDLIEIDPENSASAGVGAVFQINGVSAIPDPFTPTITHLPVLSPNTTMVDLNAAPTPSQISPLIKSFILISYNHQNSNVFDNGEMFETIDGSYLAPETFDEGMPDELAKYNATESVVINVNTNCKEYITNVVGDGGTTYELTNTIGVGMGSIQVYINDVLQTFGTDYDWQISLTEHYVLETTAPVTIGADIRIEHKINVLPISYAADDASHWDAISDDEFFLNGHSYTLDINTYGWDTKPFDATISLYRSRYLVPNSGLIASPQDAKVYLMSDSNYGIDTIDTMFNPADYVVLSITDYINNYYMVDFPSATYNEALAALVEEYRDYIGVSYIGNLDFETIVEQFSVVYFNDQHVRPIEEFVVQATATSTVDAGAVDTITVGINGSGYSYTPEITFTGGGGSGAEATAVMGEDGSIDYIIILNGGSGYASAPTVNIEDRATAHSHVGKSGQKVYIQYSMPELSHTIHYQENGGVTYTRNSYDYSTTLVDEFRVGEVEIKIADASIFGPVSIYAPGVIWIANERLTFTNIEDNTTYFTLQGVIRATNGTSMPDGLRFVDGVYPIGQRVFNGDTANQVPSGGNWLWTNSNAGLANSSTPQAMFLRAHPGCKHN